MILSSEYHPQFFTATILEWKHLLRFDSYKTIITDSMSFLVREKRVAIYAFVIMRNHIHLIWQMLGGHQRQNVQRDFLKFTAQRMKADMSMTRPAELEKFRVNAKDREFQIWERNPLSIDLYTTRVFCQKLNYIHQNPVRKGICSLSTDYRFSSARYYESGVKEWDFLSDYRGRVVGD